MSASITKKQAAAIKRARAIVAKADAAAAKAIKMAPEIVKKSTKEYREAMGRAHAIPAFTKEREDRALSFLINPKEEDHALHSHRKRTPAKSKVRKR